MGKRHPLLLFCYFLLLIVLSVCFINPWFSAFSFAGAFLYYALLIGKSAFKRLFALLPLFLLAALVNPLFNHRGVNILFYLPGGNPFTAEAFLFGVCASLMLAATLFWCFCFSLLFDSDKLHALIGKRFPRLYMLLSLTFYFIPHFTARTKEIYEAKKGIGEEIPQNGVLNKIKYAVEIFSSLLDRQLEQSLDYAAALSARGYNLKPRTCLTLYRFNFQDLLFLIFFLLLLFLLFWDKEALAAQFFPLIKIPTPKALSILCWSFLFFFPTAQTIYEVIKWKRLNAEI